MVSLMACTHIVASSEENRIYAPNVRARLTRTDNAHYTHHITLLFQFDFKLLLVLLRDEALLFRAVHQIERHALPNILPQHTCETA
jgi:hypothetical protein